MRHLRYQQKCALQSMAVALCVKQGEDNGGEVDRDESIAVSSPMPVSVRYLEKQLLDFYPNKLFMSSAFYFDLQLFLAKKNDRVIDKVYHLSQFVQQYLYFFSSRYTRTLILLLMMLRDYLLLEGNKEKMGEMDISLIKMIDSVWLYAMRYHKIDSPSVFMSLISNGLVMIHATVTQLNTVSLLANKDRWQQCFNVNMQLMMLNAPVCLTAVAVEHYLQSQRYLRTLWNEQRETNPRSGLLPFFRLLIPISKNKKVKNGQVYLAQITPYINKVGYLSHCLPARVKHVFLFDDQWETGIQASYSAIEEIGALSISFRDRGTGHTSFEFEGRFYHLLAPALLSSIHLAQDFMNAWINVLEDDWVLALDVDKTLMSAYTNSSGEACSMVGVGEGEIPFNTVVSVARRANATVVLTNGAAYRHSLKSYQRALQYYAYAYPDIELREHNQTSSWGACRVM